MVKMRMLAAALLSMPVWAQSWSKTDVALEAAWQAVNVCDYLTTSDIHRHPIKYFPDGKYLEYHETNPFLGRHPSQAEINRYMLLSAAAHFAISYTLKGRWRTTWQTVTLIYDLDVVNKNIKIGLRF